MKPTSFETAIRLQFDTLVKRVIDCTVKNYQKELDRRARREVLFCELPEIVVQSFAIEDEYDLIEKISFVACGIEVLVQKSELSQALEKLPEIKRNVLLLSYFERTFRPSDCRIDGRNEKWNLQAQTICVAVNERIVTGGRLKW